MWYTAPNAGWIGGRGGKPERVFGGCCVLSYSCVCMFAMFCFGLILLKFSFKGCCRGKGRIWGTGRKMKLGCMMGNFQRNYI